MAKYEKVLRDRGSLSEINEKISRGVCSICPMTKKRDSYTFTAGGVTCIFTVYEKLAKKHWVEKDGEWKDDPHYSLSVNLIDTGEEIRLHAITSGGSQELYFLSNAVGEGAMMDALKITVDMWDSIV